MIHIPRRQFLKGLALALGSAVLSTAFPKTLLSQITKHNSSQKPIVSVVTGQDKKEMLRAVVKPFGGIGAFVRKGNRVVIKPNAAWSRTPEQAANTSPQLVRGMIELCYEAGAGEVLVVEHPCDNAKSSFEVSGLKGAVKGSGAKLKALKDGSDFQSVDIPNGYVLKNVDVAKDILNADVFINMPIAKVHNAARLTLGMKNHMGAVKDRWAFHLRGLNRAIADASTVLRPNLIVIDATRILVTNGPKGPGEVKTPNMVIAGCDQVACDSFATTLFDMKPQDIGYINDAAKHGLGEMNLNRIDIKRTELLAK